MFNIWLTILVILLIVIIRSIINLFNYWKNKNVPYIPFSLPSTTTWLGYVHQNYYNWAKQNGFKHLGFFTLYVPTYVPIDLSIIKNILSTDFHNFSDRGLYYNEKDDPLGAHLFALRYPKWKKIRHTVTPTFTPGKMKTMLKSLVEIGFNLRDAVDEFRCSKQPVDIKNFLQCYTADGIGSCAFGLDCNSFKNPDSEFRNYGHKFVADAQKMILNSFLCSRYPRIADFFKMRIVSKDVADFFLNITRKTIEYREINQVIRNDFLQMLMNIKNDSTTLNDNESLTTIEIASQSLIFYAAGYETSSSTLCFCLYELSLNPEIQKRARTEINSVMKNYDGEVTYDGLTEMQYLGQVVDETLRKYPIFPMLNRSCVADYKITNTDVIIEKGTVVVIPVYAIHRDPDYYPSPELFDPERFSSPNRNKIKPFTYLPFGDGPRNCIGLRFGLLQVKVALATLLHSFAFSINDKTIHPSKMDPQIFTASMVDTLWLNVSQVKK